MRLAAIDSTGFTDQEKTSQRAAHAPASKIDEEAAEFKEWEMPVNQMGGIHTAYPAAGGRAQLHHGQGLRRLDRAPARASPKPSTRSRTNMSIGMDDHRVPPKYLLEKALDQVKELANQKPEDSPLAAAAQEVSRLHLRRRAGAHQDRDARRHRQRSAAGLPALCALS